MRVQFTIPASVAALMDLNSGNEPPVERLSKLGFEFAQQGTRAGSLEVFGHLGAVREFIGSVATAKSDDPKLLNAVKKWAREQAGREYPQAPNKSEPTPGSARAEAQRNRGKQRAEEAIAKLSPEQKAELAKVGAEARGEEVGADGPQLPPADEIEEEVEVRTKTGEAEAGATKLLKECKGFYDRALRAADKEIEATKGKMGHARAKAIKAALEARRKSWHANRKGGGK